MNELVALFAICLLVVLAAYGMRGIARRHAARLQDATAEDLEVYSKEAPHAAWRELDRQRTRSDIRRQWRQ